MLKRFPLRRIVVLVAASSAFGFSHSSFAAAFGLWEQDAASIGNYHAGTAATADDASTAWYNPAGLVRIPNQQLVVGADPILTNFRYNGTVWVSSIMTSDGDSVAPPHPAAAQGGGFNLVPFVHYAAPISDRVAFGMSVDVPFGLKTDYGSESYVRYAATLTQLQVIDYTPSLGVKLTDKLSVGAGVDFQHLQAELNQIDTAGTEGNPFENTRSHNTASDWGYGWRLGALYQFTPNTRLGLNYRSKVSHHAKGKSSFIGPLAETDSNPSGRQYSSNFFANATLPAITSLSLFHSLNPCWDVMGSVTYTQWSVFKNLILQNVAGMNTNFDNVNNLVVDIVNKYQNVWNYSFGANYHPNDQWIIRTGAGFDQTPSNDTHRNLQIPDADRIAIALGAHYQATKTIGFDAGWTHLFTRRATINNDQIFGGEEVKTNGTVNGNADVYGLQLKWDIV